MLTDEPETAGVDRRAGRQRTSLSWPLVARLAAMYLASRAIVGVVLVCAIWVSNGQQSVYGALTRWDSGWYGFIAESGYPDHTQPEAAGGNRWAFFPAWPALLRLAHSLVGGSWQRNGIVLAFLIGFATTVVVYLAVADVFGERVGDRTTTLVLLGPAGAVLSMVYSEVLFVPCAAACLLLLGRRQWTAAGLVAMIATATRIAGLALVAACLFEAVIEYRRSRSIRAFVAPVLAPLGLVAFVGYQRWRAGTWNAYSEAQGLWDNSNTAGREVVSAIARLVTNVDGWRDPPTVVASIALVVTAVGAGTLLKTTGVPGTWWIYTAIVGAMALSPSVIYSVPRLVLPVFPLAAGLAVQMNERWFPLLVGAFAAVLAVMTIVYFNTIGFSMPP